MAVVREHEVKEWAVNHLKDILVQEPENFEILTQLAILRHLSQKNDDSKAIKLLRKAL